MSQMLWKNLTGGGAPRAISRLAAAPRRSCTKVHSLAVLTAKRDIVSRMHPPMQTSVLCMWQNHTSRVINKIVFLIDLEKISQKLRQCQMIRKQRIFALFLEIITGKGYFIYKVYKFF